MAVTIRQTEEIPVSYPAILGHLELPAVWQRIEAYTAWRWTPRQVVWLVEGAGDWQAPLAPAVLQSVETWDGGLWKACTPDASAWGGYDLPGCGPYRITATVRGGECPAAVIEAARRLADYLDGMPDIAPGATSYSLNIGQVQESIEVSTSHIGRAMQNSGAADLLRPYRRA